MKPVKCEKISTGSFKNVINKMCLEILYLIYMYKKDLTLITYNGWYTLKPNPTKSYIFSIL